MGAVLAVTAGLIMLVVSVVFMATFNFPNGALMFAVSLAMIAIPLLLHVNAAITFKAEENINRMYQTVLDEVDIFRRIEPQIKIIADNSQISDNARSLANREKELETLRQAIREEMYSGDLEAANYLVDQMERRFGYAQEAKDLRAEMASVREMTIEEKINEAVTHIERLMDEYKWQRASQEMERLIKLFPRHERVTALPAELNRRREARKQELLKEWHTAVQREETDRGITLLTELDQYLTPEEAQKLSDDARHVFKARLVNLGVQFSLAVQEQRWRDALDIGVQIREEFPNSRMAKEVATKIEVLRMRAGFGGPEQVPGEKPLTPATPPAARQTTPRPAGQQSTAPSTPSSGGQQQAGGQQQTQQQSGQKTAQQQKPQPDEGRQS
jgi:hypothetical protein